MSVDFELFQEWASDYFGESNLKIKNTKHGVEITTNSIWSESQLGKTDTKRHLWMNPSGGKSKHPELGSYRCWLTDRMGSLVGLVAQLEHMDWEEAELRICGSSSLRSLERKVHEMFDHINNVEQAAPIVEPTINKVELPSDCFRVDKISPNHYMSGKSKDYLAKRKMPYSDFYVCIRGDYKNRIVIPYYDRDGELIYYNARLIDDKKDVLRYMKCPTDVVDQKEVLYMTEWPAPGTKVYLMEGEFDAKSLQICNLVGCACGGKFLSETQMELLRDYQIVLAFDADEAGWKAMIDIGNSLLEAGFNNVLYVRPPVAYKDWNKLLVQRCPEAIKDYISRCEKPFNASTADLLLSRRIG